jgi:hypothetical protein
MNRFGLESSSKNFPEPIFSANLAPKFPPKLSWPPILFLGTPFFTWSVHDTVNDPKKDPRSDTAFAREYVAVPPIPSTGG